VSPGRPLDALEQGDFVRHVGTGFRLLRSEGEGLDLTLVEASIHPHLPHSPGRRRGFSLVFRSASPSPLRQGVYRLDHEVVGSLELFLVPIGPREGGMCYEAVFN
jgi:hypothetical protein